MGRDYKNSGSGLGFRGLGRSSDAFGKALGLLFCQGVCVCV